MDRVDWQPFSHSNDCLTLSLTQIIALFTGILSIHMLVFTLSMLDKFLNDNIKIQDILLFILGNHDNIFLKTFRLTLKFII